MTTSSAEGQMTKGQGYIYDNKSRSQMWQVKVTDLTTSQGHRYHMWRSQILQQIMIENVTTFCQGHRFDNI
jgi:hypothetical protein